MKDMLVSIAMATFNGEKFLEKQLESICKQTYNNYEIIICDDGSNDHTIEIINRYKNKYKNKLNIKFFINKKNLGVVKNFENVILLCKGEYIALADQDDMWCPNKIKTLVDTIGDNLLVHSDAYLIDEKDFIYSSSFTKYTKKNVNKNDFISLLFNNIVTGCTCLFKKELLLYALPFPEQIFVHDWWLALHAANQGGICYVDMPLIKYRNHYNNEIGPQKHTHIRRFSQKEADLLKKLNFLVLVKNEFVLSGKQKKILNSLVLYYRDFFDSNFTPSAFLFRLKNFNNFNSRHNILFRIIDLLLSVFGKKIQKKIYTFYR